MNRKHLSLAALAVALVASGIALLPFGVKSSDCSPAAISAWQTHRVTDTLATLQAQRAAGDIYDPIDHRWEPAGPAQPISHTEPTRCAEKARVRLETSGVLLGLTAVGWAVGRRILRPEALAMVD